MGNSMKGEAAPTAGTSRLAAPSYLPDGSANDQPAKPAERPAWVGALSLSWEAGNRNLEHVLETLAQTAAQRADIVCLPEECVPTDGGPSAQAALATIAKAVASHKMDVAANLKEKDAEKVYLTSHHDERHHQRSFGIAA